MLVYRYYISTLYILTSTSRFRQHIASFLYENEILLSYQQQNQIKSINVIIFCCTSVYFPFIYDDGAQPARHRERKGISLSMNTSTIFFSTSSYFTGRDEELSASYSSFRLFPINIRRWSTTVIGRRKE